MVQYFQMRFHVFMICEHCYHKIQFQTSVSHIGHQTIYGRENLLRPLHLVFESQKVVFFRKSIWIVTCVWQNKFNLPFLSIFSSTISYHLVSGHQRWCTSTKVLTLHDGGIQKNGGIQKMTNNYHPGIILPWWLLKHGSWNIK